MKKRYVKKLKLKQEIKDIIMLVLFYTMFMINIIVFINQL